MNTKLPARALLYAIVVSILVALICASLLLSSYHQHQLLGRAQTQERLLRNCRSGLQLLLASSADNLPRTVVDLYGEQRDSVAIERRPWGLLDVGIVESWAGQGLYRERVAQACLLGAPPTEYALKLAESNYGLHLYGDTRIVGDAYLPDEGVERGRANIGQGRSYSGDRLIYGTQHRVQLEDKKALKARFALLEAMSRLAPNVDWEGDSLVQPFDRAPAVLEEVAWSTAGLVLKGHVILVASDYIEVAANSELEDVLLFAPRIVVRAGFEGALQAFAWDSIVVERDVRLEFPSVLSLMPYEERTPFSPRIAVGEGVEVVGTLLAPSFRYNPRPTQVVVPATASITGQVWVNGQLQLRGTVHGNVLCDEFWLQTPASVYKNYLLDAIIDRKALPSAYLAPSVLSEQSERFVLKYL